MRSFLALGLLVTLCASASAATVHHYESRHVIVRPSQDYAVRGWAYAAPRPPVHYDDTLQRPVQVWRRHGVIKKKPPVWAKVLAHLHDAELESAKARTHRSAFLQ
jgi:hypothetical protein